MATFSAVSTKPTTSRAGAAQLATLNAAAAAPSRPPRPNGSAWACLLVSDEAKRRQLLEESAVAAGWDPIPCESIGEAMKRHKRWRTQLAIVDLGSMNAASKSAYLQFAGKIAATDRLLLVCDEPTDNQGELVARQVGAWMYLPSPEFGDGMTELLSDARSIAEKIVAPRRTSQREANASPSSCDPRSGSPTP